jgi:hypothetical protein
MKRLLGLCLVLGLAVVTIGCEKKAKMEDKAAAPATSETPPADATPAAAPAEETAK